MKSERHALVIGAGIGGLCTAIALEQTGWQVTVYEQAPAPSEAGAGIVLAANAVAALTRLGVADQVKQRGAKVGIAHIRTHDGKMITQLPVKVQAERYGTFSYLVHREELQAVLAERLQNTTIHYNKKLRDFKQQNGVVTALFQDDTYAAGNILVGADGIHSAVRRGLLDTPDHAQGDSRHGASTNTAMISRAGSASAVGHSELRYSGFTALRGICNLQDDGYTPEKGGGFEAWGQGLRFGFSHLDRGRIFWFAAINAPQGMIQPPDRSKSDLLKRLNGWYEPVQRAVEATPANEILRHDIFDKIPLRFWSSGLVTLLGDAAHPMLPNLGQGGAQAMEDAVQLAACLKQHADPVAAMQAYQKIRIPRTSRVVRQSRRMGRVVQLENPLAIAFRNQLLRRMPGRLQMKQLDWLLSYRSPSI
ncbi:FAD-dependent oxidoreductase [Paenibacillus pinihumi]|uniref:FAD-dependent oxidoreductase n=1 Tax=Paenibacillus pinihumi TaxID=669462 RepID=UPI000401B076|nr:FAD-dependent oxidoreductase [Paenibacillus pinihumi]